MLTGTYDWNSTHNLLIKLKYQKTNPSVIRKVYILYLNFFYYTKNINSRLTIYTTEIYFGWVLCNHIYDIVSFVARTNHLASILLTKQFSCMKSCEFKFLYHITCYFLLICYQLIYDTFFQVLQPWIRWWGNIDTTPEIETFQMPHLP